MMRLPVGLALLCLGSLARGNVAERVGNGWGVQVQAWRTTAADLSRIRGAGLGLVRWGIAREAVEAAPGRYEWSGPDRMFAALHGQGLASVVTLAEGAEGAAPPVTAQERAAFARFAAAAARRYARHAPLWELWNEPDIARFWPPAPNGPATARLLSETCQAIKAADRAAVVIGPASAALPNATERISPGLYAALAASPAATCLDALSMHAYRLRGSAYPDPEGALGDLYASRRVLARLRPAWARVPVIVSEWGYPTSIAPPALQSAYFVRTRLVNLMGRVSATIWYEWQDSAASAASVEAHFGLMDAANAAKAPLPPVARALATARFVRRIPSNDPRVFAALFRRGEETLVVVWLRSADLRERRRVHVGTRVLEIGYQPVMVAVPEPPVRIAADG
jgi:hypothetical protein